MLDLILADLRAALTIANQSQNELHQVGAIEALNIATDDAGVSMEELRYLAGRGVIEVIAERSALRSDPHAASHAEALLLDCIAFVERDAVKPNDDELRF